MSLTARGAAFIAQNLYSSPRVHRRSASPGEITEEHVRHYRQRGFLAVQGVFTPAEVEAAKAGLAHLITGGNPAFKGMWLEETAKGKQLSAEQVEPYVRKLMWFVEHEPRLRAISEHPTIRSILRSCWARIPG